MRCHRDIESDKTPSQCPRSVSVGSILPEGRSDWHTLSSSVSTTVKADTWCAQSPPKRRMAPIRKRSRMCILTNVPLTHYIMKEKYNFYESVIEANVYWFYELSKFLLGKEDLFETFKTLLSHFESTRLLNLFLKGKEFHCSLTQTNSIASLPVRCSMSNSVAKKSKRKLIAQGSFQNGRKASL